MWSRRTAVGAVLGLMACSDTTSLREAGRQAKPAAPQAYVDPNACGVRYTSITSIDDDELRAFEVPARTDTVRVCETWDGSDYRAHMQTTGSSEPPGETADPTRVVTYESGVAAGTDASGAPTDDGPTAIGSSSFDVVQATESEQQASYNEPYYAIYTPQDPGSCEYQPRGCLQTARLGVPGPLLSRTAADSTKKPRREHGFRRSGLRWLVGDLDEVERAPNGHRRFRSLKGDDEQIMTVDPKTELLVEQEYRSKREHTRAKLTWVPKGTKFVRERMEIDTDDFASGKPKRTQVVVTLRNVEWGAP